MYIQIIFIGKASIQIIQATPMENVSLCPYVLFFFLVENLTNKILCITLLHAIMC